MNELDAQQQNLLRTLFGGPGEIAIELGAVSAHSIGARGLQAYKANGHMLAERALLAAYPVVTQLLGAESAAELARALWHAHPPTQGDMALWGATLADFLANNTQLQEEPYLADVARAEWALHCCAVALDAPADPASLVLLTTEDPDLLGVRLAPGCAVLRSAWPVASILGAHVLGVPSLADAGAELRDGVAQEVLVWRQGFRPQFRQALPGETALLGHLLSGATLGQALDLSKRLDFAQWFPMAIASQLVLGVFVQNSAAT